MLQTNKTHIEGFLVAIEVDDDIKATLEQIAFKLDDGVRHMEGVGRIDIDPLGEIEVIVEDDDKTVVIP